MDLSSINELLAFVCPNVLMPLLNQLLAKGIAIPSIAPQFRLVQAEIAVGDGYLLIGGDLQVDASASASASVAAAPDATATIVATETDESFELIG